MRAAPHCVAPRGGRARAGVRRPQRAERAAPRRGAWCGAGGDRGHGRRPPRVRTGRGEARGGRSRPGRQGRDHLGGGEAPRPRRAAGDGRCGRARPRPLPPPARTAPRGARPRRAARYARERSPERASAEGFTLIAALAGTLSEKSPERLVVDVGGVGYALHVSLQTFTDLPPAGVPVRLLIHTEVREDAIELIGFLSERERALFHLLRKVKGLGPRTALVVLSGMPLPELARTIAAGDAARLQTIAGVGKKYAERIVVECREPAAALAAGAPTRARSAPDGILDEAVSALVNLGYKRPEAERAVEQTGRAGAPLEEVIRAALQGLSA